MVLTDAIVDCGAYDIAFYLNDGSKTPLDPAIFDVRKPTGEFARLFTSDLSHIGAYDILYEISYLNYGTVSVESPAPFTVEITPVCTQATTFSPSVLVDQDYTISDAEKSFIFDPFVVDPAFCAIDYTYTIADVSGDVVISSFTSATREFRFEYSIDLAPSLNTDPSILFNDYQITITGTTGTLTPSSVSQTYNLKVRNPCPNARLSL